MATPGGSLRISWAGAVACMVGVLLYLPMYFGSASMGYRMAGMHPDALTLGRIG